MIAIREDKISHFVQVTHTGSGDLYRLHQDDLPKVGTNTKVAVYEQQSADFLPPSAQFPKGRYRARVKYFVAAYLEVCQTSP